MRDLNQSGDVDTPQLGGWIVQYELGADYFPFDSGSSKFGAQYFVSVQVGVNIPWIKKDFCDSKNIKILPGELIILV